MANFNTWYNQTINRPIDIDGTFGDQCVDIAMSWAQFCFPGHQWPELLGYGDAKDLFNAASVSFFDKLPNQQAKQGDLVVFGATATNPYGHIAAVISDDGTTMVVIEQNGFNPSGVSYVAHRPHNNVIGFLRPKTQLEEEEMSSVEYNELANILNKQVDSIDKRLAALAAGSKSTHDDIYKLIDQMNAGNKATHDDMYQILADINKKLKG